MTSHSSSLNLIRTGPSGSPVVVLVHAVGLDLTYWDSQIYALSERFDVIAYDLLGHGASCAPTDGYKLDLLANDLAGVIQTAGPGAAHVVGLSVGGMIAQSLAAGSPELVRSLSLINTAATLSDPARAAMRQSAQTVHEDGMAAVVQPTLERWFTSEFAARRPEVLDRVTKTLLRNSKRVHAAMWESIADLDVAARLSNVRCPTLVLVGERDQSTPVAASQLIADRIPGARMHILANVSHMSPIEAPTEVNARLVEFLVNV